jgi:hypothetical protein
LGGVHGDAVNAVAHFRSWVGHEFGAQSAVDRLPRLARIVGAESAGGGDGDEDAAGVLGVQKNRVQAHPTSTRLPARSCAVLAQAGEFLPGVTAIRGAEESGVFDAGIDDVGIGQGGFEMPDAFEFPGVGFAVVPLVGAGDAVVDEFVAFTFRYAVGRFCYSAARRFPCFAAVVRALDDLPEPVAGLGSIDAVWVGGGAFEVVDLPAAEVGAGDIPTLAFGVGGEDECAFACTDEDADLAHGRAPFPFLQIIPAAFLEENGFNRQDAEIAKRSQDIGDLGCLTDRKLSP